MDHLVTGQQQAQLAGYLTAALSFGEAAVLLVAVAACVAAGIVVSRAIHTLRIPLAQFSELKLVALFASVLCSALLRFMYTPPSLTTKPK